MSKPAVPANLRGLVVMLAVVSALVVAVLAVDLHGSHGPGLFDGPVIATVRSAWPEAGAAAYAVDAFAAPVPALIIVAALVVGCLLAKRWRLAAVAAVGPLSAPAGTAVLKPLVDRTIHGDNLAFPSGHTAFAAAIALLLGLLLVGLLRLGRALGGVVLLGLTLIAGGAMSVNQVVLDAHYPTDTVGGFCLAVTAVSVVALLVDALANRVLKHYGR